MQKGEIPILRPCSERWEDMEGDSRRRHCCACEREVYDLSAMTRGEAEPLLRRRRAGEEICVRYAIDRSGEVQFREASQVPVALLRPARRIAVGAGLLGAALSGCASRVVTKSTTPPLAVIRPVQAQAAPGQPAECPPQRERQRAAQPPAAAEQPTAPERPPPGRAPATSVAGTPSAGGSQPRGEGVAEDPTSRYRRPSEGDPDYLMGR